MFQVGKTKHGYIPHRPTSHTSKSFLLLAGMNGNSRVVLESFGECQKVSEKAQRGTNCTKGAPKKRKQGIVRLSRIP